MRDGTGLSTVRTRPQWLNGAQNAMLAAASSGLAMEMRSDLRPIAGP